jgi:hypothetical protein
LLLLIERHGSGLLLADEFLKHLLSLLLLHLVPHHLFLLLLALLPLGILLVYQRHVLGHLINVEHLLLFLLKLFLLLLVVSGNQRGIHLPRVLSLREVPIFHHPLLICQLGVLGDLRLDEADLRSLGQLLFIVDELEVAA